MLRLGGLGFAAQAANLPNLNPEPRRPPTMANALVCRRRLNNPDPGAWFATQDDCVVTGFRGLRVWFRDSGFGLLGLSLQL